MAEFHEKNADHPSVGWDNLVAYASYDFPWPISNRDIIVKTKLYMDIGKTKTVRIEITGTTHTDYPENNGTIRVKEYSCFALLEEIDNHKTRVTYTIKADPGGNIPPVAVNVIAKEAQYMTLKNLRKMALNPKYSSPSPKPESDQIVNAKID